MGRISFNLITIITLSVFTLIADSLRAQNTHRNFEHLRVEDGLSQSTIFSIYKDKKEFLWLGTRRGLNRYDGHQIKQYFHDSGDTTSLSSNAIIKIIGDKKDNLLIQTNEEVNYFNRYKEQFIQIETDEYFLDFEKDLENNIWACSANGVFRFNETTRTFSKYSEDPRLSELYKITLDQNYLWCTGGSRVVRVNLNNQEIETFDLTSVAFDSRYFFIDSDKNGTVWACSLDGSLSYFDPVKYSFIPYDLMLKDQKMIVSSFGRGLDNTILIGTNGKGLIEIDKENDQVRTYNHLPDDKASLSSNTIYSIYSDDVMGMVWLGGYMGGLDYYSRYDKGFRFKYHEPFNENSIINNNIRSLQIDSRGNIWLGTRQGISVLDSSNTHFQSFDEEMLMNFTLSNPVITRIYEDPNGFIWLCTYRGGTIIYDPKTKKIENVQSVYPHIEIPNNLGVFDVLMDNHQNVWVAAEEGTYLYPYNKKGIEFDRAFAKVMIQDRAGRLFFGTSNNGLFHVNNQTLQLSPVELKSDQVGTIKRINTLYAMDNGDIWIGTGGHGILTYNPSTGDISQFDAGDGLYDNNISGIVADKNDNIWITTYSGLYRYSKELNSFKHVYLERGVQGKEFNPGSISISSKGVLYAGSVNGLLTFNTNQYKENPYLPSVVFTDLFINDKQIKAVGDQSPLTKSIMFTDKIALQYDQNSFRLNFTAPTYYMGDKVKFFYKFGNQEAKWTDLGTNRSINFANLNPGDYTLIIKAINSDGHSLSSGTTLFVKVAPPFWETKWALMIYVLIICLLAFLVWLAVKFRIRLRYQVFAEKAERQKQVDINNSRIRLFTDVSHEIGTSLTLINVPLETLMNVEVDDLKKHQLNIINKNVSRLKQLVKRIIDLRRIETGKMKLQAEKSDMVSFIDSICKNYESMARKNKVNFQVEFSEEKVETWFDKEKVECIIYNLLSNAFKFEPENGIVSLSLTTGKGSIKGINKKIIQIEVANLKSNIVENEAQNIFERFYSGKANTFGSGIGLSLIKSYLDIHKGEINLDTQRPHSGVVFTVKIPYGESFLEADEKINSEATYEMITPIYLDTEEEDQYDDYYEELDQGTERSKILIVEHNYDLKRLLKEHLSQKYEIIEASDGEEGLIKAKNFIPDLILTDYKMPDMGGVQLCQSMKSDLDISHIPIIILLKGQEDMEVQIHAMEAGADACISKPFQMTYVKSVIFNLIQLRKNLKRKYYHRASVMDESVEELKSFDENFMEKANRIMEENLNNLQFGIPLFAEKLGVTKYMLYTKIKNLSGQTPNNYITIYKLKKAAHILKNSDLSDLEVYGKVGFNDVSYFRKCFKKQFGMTPNQFNKSSKFIQNS